MAKQDHTMAKWMLPEGIEEVLPARARVMEQLRRNLLDYYSSCGYDLIMKAYQEAIKKKYRFLTYGDTMLII